MKGLLSENVKITKVADAAGAGTTDVTSAALDMLGYDGVLFLTSLATANAASKLKVQCSQQSGGSPDAYRDIKGAETAVGASDEDLVVDVRRPPERYLKAVVSRGASSACGDIWAIQYYGDRMPITNTLAGTLRAAAVAVPIEETTSEPTTAAPTTT